MPQSISWVLIYTACCNYSWQCNYVMTSVNILLHLIKPWRILAIWCEICTTWILQILVHRQQSISWIVIYVKCLIYSWHRNYLTSADIVIHWCQAMMNTGHTILVQRTRGHGSILCITQPKSIAEAILYFPFHLKYNLKKTTIEHQISLWNIKYKNSNKS